MISTGSVTDKLLRWLQCRNHNFAKLQYFHQCVNNTVFRVATYRQGMLCLCRINFHKNHYPNNHHCLPAINKTVNRELSTVNYKKQKSRTLLSIRLSLFNLFYLDSVFCLFLYDNKLRTSVFCVLCLCTISTTVYFKFRFSISFSRDSILHNSF